MIKVSVYSGFTDPGDVVDLAEVMDAIRNGEFRTVIEELRNCEGEEYERRKKKLPFFTPSGTFSPSRKKENIAEYNRMMVLDFDHVVDAEGIRDRAARLDTTYAAFLSPGGHGVKILVKTDATIGTHEQAMARLGDHYNRQLGVETDPSGKDISRACFVSYDEGLYLNEGSEIFSASTSTGLVEFSEPTTTGDGFNYYFQRSQIWAQSKSPYYPGNRNNHIHLLACELNRYGMDRQMAELLVRQHYTDPDMQDQITRLMNNGFSHVEEHGQYTTQIRNSDPLEVLRELEETTAPTEETAPAAEEAKKYGTPFIPEDIYSNLPKFLQDCSSKFENPRERDIFLTGALSVLSGCFNNVHGIYRKKNYSLHLYSFVVAPPASGKGVLDFARRLGAEIHSKMIENMEVEKHGYFFIPANTSAAAFQKALAANENTGVMFESEADTLTNALAQDWGSFDDIIRKAFHHETISMNRMEKEGDGIVMTEITRPRLAICLSGTPGQVPTLLKSTENGLFSRFTFYTFKEKNTSVFDDVYDDEEDGDIDLDAFFDEKGKELAGIAELVRQKGDIRILLNKDQRANFKSAFKNSYKVIVDRYGEEADAIVLRLGLVFFRIAMILTILRAVEEDRLDSTILVEDVDFEASLTLTDLYLEHSLSVFMTLPGNNSANRTAMFLLEHLPSEFVYKEAVKIGMGQCSICERTVAKCLKTLVNSKLLLQSKEHGPYMRADKI